MTTEHQDTRTLADRRRFLKTATLFGAALATHAHARANEEIRVGLVGCGGRGTGAAMNCLEADPNVKLVAMGDAFEDRLEASLATLKKQQNLARQVAIEPERCFVGLDAYRKVINSGVDLVLLATPGVFRPEQLLFALSVGKHVFAEKPVAVDATGIRRVLAASAEAKRKNLSVVVGTQRRYQTSYREAIKRLHDGAIGKITAAECWWNQGPVWRKDRQPGMSDLEWQLRNWINISWLSGDIIVEHLTHNLDVITWALQGHPLRVVSLDSGRLPETGASFGNRFDHFEVEYDFPGGVKVKGQCRWLANRPSKVAEAIHGTKGVWTSNSRSITGEQPWRFMGQDNNPYAQELVELIRSIRDGRPRNDLPAAAESTLTAIMGRIAAYTGETITWEQASNSPEDFLPAGLAFDRPLPLAPVPTPRKPARGVDLPSLYILAVGISKYKDESLNLNYAAKDAEATVKAFKEYGKPLFAKIEDKLLMDKDATRDGILQGMTWLREQMTQRDFGVVFFSGHGDRDTDGSLYLLPTNVDPNDLLSTGVPAEQLKKALQKLPGKVLALLDAGHAGGIDGGKRKSIKSLPDELVRDLISDESGLVVMCSSTGREFSEENNKFRQGNFTQALIEGLSGKATKGTDGAIYLHHLDAYVTDRVKELTRGRQHPVTAKPSTIRSFPLARP